MDKFRSQSHESAQALERTWVHLSLGEFSLHDLQRRVESGSSPCRRAPSLYLTQVTWRKRSKLQKAILFFPCNDLTLRQNLVGPQCRNTIQKERGTQHCRHESEKIRRQRNGKAEQGKQTPSNHLACLSAVDAADCVVNLWDELMFAMELDK